MDPERITDDVRRFFADDPGDAVAVYLFGSVARGTAHAESDVDVGVLLADDPPRTLAGLRLDVQSDLELRLGVPVQLIVLNRAPADLVHRVLRDGRRYPVPSASGIRPWMMFPDARFVYTLPQGSR